MGSTLSICNASNLTVDMALSQAGPLYYENKVRPGQCWRKAVGKVWFTVDAKCHTREDDAFTDWSVAKPIITYSAVGIGMAAIGGGATPFLGLGSAVVGGISFVAGSASTIGGLTLELCPKDAANVIKRLSVSSKGWYCGSDLTRYIRGGPETTCFSGSGSSQHIVITDEHFPPLEVVEECPKGFHVTKYIESYLLKEH